MSEANESPTPAEGWWTTDDALRVMTARAERAEAALALRAGTCDEELRGRPQGRRVMARILVTGSRDWTDVATVRAALSDAWQMLGRPTDAVLVQGECHLGGADQIAAETWRGWGFPVEGHPAEMGPDGHVLGPKRNAHMVSLGADVCLAFPLPSSRGTKNCVRLAREAGIPVRIYEPQA